jgi:hypothetical protein
LRNFGLVFAAGASNSSVRGLSILQTAGLGLGIQAIEANGLRIEGCWLGVDFNGSAVALRKGIDSGPNNIIGGASAAARNVVLATAIAITIANGAQVSGNLLGVRPNGAVFVNAGPSASEGVFVGGSGALLSNNRLSGYTRAIQVLTIAGANQIFNNRIISNAVGVLVNASDQQLVDNTLQDCGEVGIFVGTIQRTTLAKNRIISCGLALDLFPVGPTLNDLGDVDTGANDLQNFPVLSAAARNGDLVTVQGTLNSLANTTFRIRFCGMASPVNSFGGCDQGQIGTHLTVLTNAQGNASFSAVLALPEGGLATHVSATAARALSASTDEGSEFSSNRVITENNSPPVFSPNANGFSRQAGSSDASAVVFGSVSDLETPLANLQIAATTGGTASAFSISASNVNGSVQGSVSALCNASSGTIRFEVSDGELTANDDIALTVTPNTPPSLGYPANVALQAASAASISPSAPPSDTGTLSSVQLQSQGSFAGSIAVNAAGVLTIANASPPGVHTIIVRALDNCGASTDASLLLTVDSGVLLRDGFE